jgi:hypothetical protein
MPRQRRAPPEDGIGLVAAFSVQTPLARKTPEPPPLDPDFAARLKASLADPRPSIAAADVRAELRAYHEARLKRGA